MNDNAEVRRNKKVFIGLSGGVDSAVSAALLKRNGYSVTGVFIKVWSPNWLPCTWREDRRDAMRVAAHLDIPFITLDLEKEYKKDVVDYMIAEYKAGRVPNPDVMCNKSVKFGAFLNFAMENEADFVATGHYAQIESKTNNKEPRTYTLLKGKDGNKDQSYFLWTLTQKQLEHIIFPVGHLLKPKVRALAKKFKLPVAEKKDSQGLCFIGKVDMKEFLSHFINEQHGDVLSENGMAIGVHDGAFFYTIGQRHGFTVFNTSTGDMPYYVVAKDIKKNTLIVSHTSKTETYGIHDVSLEDVNWIAEYKPQTGRYAAKMRYRQDDIPCSLEMRNNATIVHFSAPEAVVPGQSMVIYGGDECFGGGIIA